LKSVSDLYGVPLSSYENVELDDGKIVPSYRKKATLYGKEHTVIVSLSDELKKGQVKELNKQIGKFEEAITELNKSLENPRGTMDKRKQSLEDRIKKMLLPNFYFPDFINVSYKTEEMADPILLREFKKEEKQAKKENRDPELCIEGKLIHKPEEIPLVSIVKSVSYEIDNNKKESVIDKYYGKHLLVTDQDDWDTKRILTVYRDQEFIERFFQRFQRYKSFLGETRISLDRFQNTCSRNDLLSRSLTVSFCTIHAQGQIQLSHSQSQIARLLLTCSGMSCHINR